MDKKVLTISATTPPAGALDRVLAALYHKQQQSRLWHVRTFAATAVLSAAALVPAVISLVKALAASDVWTYMSLLFSDTAFWKDITAALIGSLPAVSLMVALALLGTLLWSVRGMARYTYAI